MTETKPEERRLVPVYRLTVCTNGHVVDAQPTGEKDWQIPCPSCGDWTWEDNYCGWCGVQLRKELTPHHPDEAKDPDA